MLGIGFGTYVAIADAGFFATATLGLGDLLLRGWPCILHSVDADGLLHIDAAKLGHRLLMSRLLIPTPAPG